MRQVSPSAKRERLRPYNWESSDQWYNMNDARFLIFNPKDSLGVDAATGLNTWGDPQETKTLDGFHILIWAAPIHFSGRQ